MVGSDFVVLALAKSSSCLQVARLCNCNYAHTHCVQVRNTANGIVQLEYGDDGRDPLAMEGSSGQPLDFERMLSHLRATTAPGGVGDPSDDARRHAVSMLESLCRCYHVRALLAAVRES